MFVSKKCPVSFKGFRRTFTWFPTKWKEWARANLIKGPAFFFPSKNPFVPSLINFKVLFYLHDMKWQIPLSFLLFCILFLLSWNHQSTALNVKWCPGYLDSKHSRDEPQLVEYFVQLEPPFLLEWSRFLLSCFLRFSNLAQFGEVKRKNSYIKVWYLPKKADGFRAITSLLTLSWTIFSSEMFCCCLKISVFCPSLI